MCMTMDQHASALLWCCDWRYCLHGCPDWGFCCTAGVAHCFDPSYTLLISIWITSYQRDSLDALLTYLICDGPPFRQYAALKSHKLSMLGFYETAVLLHEYCAYQRVRLFTAYLYMLEFVAWSLRSWLDSALFLSSANRCWKHSLVHAVIHRVYLTLDLALHYETLIDGWAWHYRSKILVHYSYKIHQIWISYTAFRWQQFEAQHTVPPRAYEYCSLMIRETRLLILHRKSPFAEVTSRLVHVSLDDLDISMPRLRRKVTYYSCGWPVVESYKYSLRDFAWSQFNWESKSAMDRFCVRRWRYWSSWEERTSSFGKRRIFSSFSGRGLARTLRILCTCNSSNEESAFV